VGEVACTGVHGANRLASNSLTEGIVAGTRVGRDLAWELPEEVQPGPATGDVVPEPFLVDPDQRRHIRAAMSRHVGVLRSPDGLAAAAEALGVPVDATVAHRRSWEATNLLTVASAVVAAATARTESRGCHRRTDHPEPRDVWLTHLDVHLAPDSPSAAVVTVTGIPPSGGYL
jgi:L-aspartate oxidase